METVYAKTISPGGRARYKPIGIWATDTFPVGAHLVVVGDTWETRKFNIDPDSAALLAAANTARRAMLDAMSEASRLRPQSSVLDEVEQTAYRVYANYLKLAGRDPKPMIYTAQCLSDVIDAGVSALLEEAAK